MEEKQLRILEKMAGDIEVMRKRTGSPRRSMLLGLFQGLGIVIGGIVAIALIGALLSVLSTIPGFDSLENALKSAVNAYEHR